MDRKYSIITGFMGKVKDRFIDYQPARSMEEMVKMASGIKGCSGLEVVYPQNFTDAGELKKLLDAYGLGVSTVNLNVKGDEIWRYGSFTHPDLKVRRKAIDAMKEAMDKAAQLECPIVTCALLNDGVDYPFEINYIDAFQYAVEGIREAAEYRKDVKISLNISSRSQEFTACLIMRGKWHILHS